MAGFGAAGRPPKMKAPTQPGKPPGKAASPFVMQPPRIKPAQMRNYGKGLSNMSGGATPAAFGGGVGFGGN